MRNPKKYQKPVVWFGIAAIVAVLCLAALASDSVRIEKPAAVDVAQYSEFIENEVFDIQDLAEGAEIQRRFFNRITPPGFSWIQPMFPAVVPFDAANFDEKFLGELLGEDKNSVAIYPLSLALDPKTRETLVYNADGKLIATIPADKNLRSWPEDADPSRVVLQLDFLPSEDVEPYLYVESRLAESVSSPRTKSKPARDGEFTMKSLGASEFGLCNILKLTNGNMRLTVTNGTDVVEVYAYTVLHTASVVVVTWTNEQSNVVTDTNTLWTPVSPSFNGIESAWVCQTTNLVLTNGVGIWEDSNISSNDRVRIYGVANRMDSDEDGLTDGTEILLHRTDASEIDSDSDYLLDGHDITVDGEDSRYELWAAAGIVHVDDNGLRTFRGEIDAGTDPLDSDTDDDNISDGEDPEPITPNQEPLVRFRHPLDGQEFSGPAKIALTSDWLYGNETPSHVVYEIVSEADGTTNEIQVAAGDNQTNDWYAPPGDFHLLVHGIDATGQTGETHRVDITVGESDSFAALSSADKQSVLENGPTAVEGVEEWTYNYSVIRTGNMPMAVSGSRTVAGFASATNFTVVPVSNSYLSVDYHDRDLMYASVAMNTPTTNLHATLYGVRRWGARVEVDLPPPGAASRDWAVDTMLVFDQNERGEWVGKVYPSLNNVASNDPFALLNLGLGWERDAFLYRNGSYQSLTGPGNYNGQDDIRLVFGLNNDGLMVGAGFDYDSYESGSWLEHYQPLAYRSGQTGTVLSVSTQALGGAAYAVNDKGVIVGCEILEGDVPRAVKWVDGNAEPLYGLSGATESVALDISEDGAIAGMKKVNGQWLPFLADEGGSDALPSAAISGVDFKEFWHVGEYGALGWGVSNNAQHLYWVIPDNDQDGFSDIIEQKIVDAVPNDELTSIADVASSIDYDGDGLTNLQEWEMMTDPMKKDSDGDHIKDGVDPFPVTRRDRDGDGLPDDWENYYGLNPGSASGANGASGDPDGDGFTNIEEYRLDSSPTSPVGLGYRFHREKLGQLRVDIQDSTNCAGTQGSRQFVERRIKFVEVTNSALPPIKFKFRVRAAGRVERQNSGFDVVRVNDEFAFGGTSEGLECQMGDKSGSVLVTVQSPPGELVLSYDTVDGLYHVGAYATVTDIELEEAITNTILDSVEIVGAPQSGLVIENGENVTFAAHILPSGAVPPAGEPKWYYQRFNADGTWGAWQSFGAGANGTQYVHTATASGIFHIKAVLSMAGTTSERIYVRTTDDQYSSLHAGDADAFAVVDTSIQIDVRNEALGYLGSMYYTFYGSLPFLRDPYGLFGSGKNKCNVFVADVCVGAGADVDPPAGWIYYASPHSANQWAGMPDASNPSAPLPIPNWVLLPDNTPPQPGRVAASGNEWGSSGHAGIVDYDGRWISASSKPGACVNRNAVFGPDYKRIFTNGVYMNAGQRQYEP